jgi:transcriptional regulator with XRE-family HTH domain
MISTRKIRQLRIEKGISQQKLAEVCNLSAAHLSLIERGERNPSLKTLSRIAENLNVPLRTLLDDGLRSDLEILASRYDVKDIMACFKEFIQSLHDLDKNQITK